MMMILVAFPDVDFVLVLDYNIMSCVFSLPILLLAHQIYVPYIMCTPTIGSVL